MGHSITWLACRGLGALAAYQRLGLTEPPRTAEYARAKFTAHMVCWSEHWRDGTRRWRIEHSSEKGPAHLQAEGELPEAVAAWVAGAEAAQAADAEVDAYFDVPLQAAQQLVGFKHDETHPALGYDSFVVLQPEGGERKWWHRGR